jgi:hypothetical protein
MEPEDTMSRHKIDCSGCEKVIAGLLHGLCPNNIVRYPNGILERDLPFCRMTLYARQRYLIPSYPVTTYDSSDALLVNFLAKGLQKPAEWGRRR